MSWSKPLDHAGVDQQPVEPPRLGAVSAEIEQPVAALEDPLLFGERSIERYTGSLQENKRQERGIEAADRRRQIGRTEVERIDGIIGGEISRIGGIDASIAFAGLIAPGLYQFNVVVAQVGDGDQPLIAELRGLLTCSNLMLPVQR